MGRQGQRITDPKQRRSVDQDEVGFGGELRENVLDSRCEGDVTTVRRERPERYDVESACPSTFHRPEQRVSFGATSIRETTLANGTVPRTGVSVKPGCAETLKNRCSDGRRKSRSTSTTRRPALANATARFAAVVDLPSPSTALARGRGGPGAHRNHSKTANLHQDGRLAIA